MEDASVDLVEEFAKTLTQETAKGSVTMVRGWITRIFKGNEDRKQRALRELEDSHQEMTGDDAGSVQVEDIEQNWKSQLRRLLREDPSAADELRTILDEVAPERGAQSVTNTTGDVSGISVQGGQINGGVHQHETHYGGDHIDMRGVQAKGNVIGTQNNYGDRHRES